MAMQAPPEIAGLEPVDAFGFRYSLSSAEIRAILIAAGVQIYVLKVSRRSIELVQRTEAETAIFRHLIEQTTEGESYKPLTERVDRQAREIDDLKFEVKALAAQLGMNRMMKGVS